MFFKLEIVLIFVFLKTAQAFTEPKSDSNHVYQNETTTIEQAINEDDSEQTNGNQIEESGEDLDPKMDDLVDFID